MRAIKDRGSNNRVRSVLRILRKWRAWQRRRRNGHKRNACCWQHRRRAAVSVPRWTGCASSARMPPPRHQWRWRNNGEIILLNRDGESPALWGMRWQGQGRGLLVGLVPLPVLPRLQVRRRVRSWELRSEPVVLLRLATPQPAQARAKEARQ
jgi:hypothetical protein